MRQVLEPNDQITALGENIFALHHSDPVSFEMYDPNLDTWEFICQPPECGGKFVDIAGGTGLLHALYFHGYNDAYMISYIWPRMSK